MLRTSEGLRNHIRKIMAGKIRNFHDYRDQQGIIHVRRTGYQVEDIFNVLEELESEHHFRLTRDVIQIIPKK